jgi:hypothetical protein
MDFSKIIQNKEQPIQIEGGKKKESKGMFLR